MLASCSLFKKADNYSDQTPIEVIPDEEMLTDGEISEEESLEDSTPNEDAEIKPFLTYSRSYCFGMCPVFNSKIFIDGTVEYEGINFVDNMGKFTGKLSQINLDSLKSKLLEISYFQLDSIYDNPNVMDIPSVITSANLDGKNQKVFDRWKAPKPLKTLYKMLDDIYTHIEWSPATE